MLDVVAGLGVPLLSPCPCPCPCPCACACARQPSDFSATAGDGESGDFGKQRRLQGRCRTAGACFAGCGAQPHSAWHAGFDVHQQSTQCILWDGLPILCRELMAPLPLRHTKLPRGKRLLHKKPQSPPPALPARHGQESSAFSTGPQHQGEGGWHGGGCRAPPLGARARSREPRSPGATGARQVPTGQITTKTALARPLPASAGAGRAENIEVAKVKGEQQEARRARQGAGRRRPQESCGTPVPGSSLSPSPSSRF